MNDLLILLARMLITVAKRLGAGSTNAIFANSLLLKQQLPIMNRDGQADVVIKPSTRLNIRCKPKQ